MRHQSCTISRWVPFVANSNALSFDDVSASASTLAFSKTLTTPSCPSTAALCSGVMPLISSFGSAPFSTNSWRCGRGRVCRRCACSCTHRIPWHPFWRRATKATSPRLSGQNGTPFEAGKTPPRWSCSRPNLFRWRIPPFRFSPTSKPYAWPCLQNCSSDPCWIQRRRSVSPPPNAPFPRMRAPLSTHLWSAC